MDSTLDTGGNGSAGSAGQMMNAAGAGSMQTAAGGNAQGGASGSSSGASSSGASGASTAGSAGMSAGGTGTVACAEGEQRGCFTGPADARNRGQCVDGMQVCSGGDWGACTGQVLPVHEICSDSLDNDCDGLADDCGNFVCAGTFGGAPDSEVYVNGIAPGGTGFITVAGQFTGSVDFGGKTLTSAGGYDIFLASYTPDCKLFWAESFGTPLLDVATSVLLMDNYDIVVGGYEGQPPSESDKGMGIDLGGGALVNPQNLFGGDAFLARYDKHGNHVWSHLYGEIGNDSIQALALAPNHDILVTGSGSDFGLIVQNPGALVVRFNGNGNPLWATTLYPEFNSFPSAPPIGYGITVDPNDNVFVSGSYDAGALSGGVNVGALTTTFLSALTGSGGKPIWSKTARTIYPPGATDTADTNLGYTVAANATQVAWGGVAHGPIDFGGGQLAGFGDSNGFLASYDTAGAIGFSSLRVPFETWLNQLTFDRQGNIVAVGAGSFGAGAVQKYSSGGRMLQSKIFLTATIRAVTVGNGSINNEGVTTGLGIAVAGEFDGADDFGDGPRTARGNHDGVFVIYRD